MVLIVQPKIPTTLPVEVEKRLKHLGTEGAAWRASLAETIARLQHQWTLSVGKVLRGGSEALVMEAWNAPGDELVIKLLLPAIAEPGQTEALQNNERRVLQSAQGRGYVRLLDADAATGAMLMPRLGPALGQVESNSDTQQRVLCETLKKAWLGPTEGLNLQSGAQKARWLRTLIIDLAAKHAQYISAETLSIAVDFTHRRERAHDQAHKVLVHGDPHPLNALRDRDGGYVMIDPDGLYAEAEYDMGVVMREWSNELLQSATSPINLGKSRCERLARLSGTQPLAIWQWGYIERVSTGLYTLELDMPDYGKPALQVADSWAKQGARLCYESSENEFNND